MDQVAEYRRLQELYARMNEGEIEVVANEAYDLTDMARPLLRDEIARRGLKIPLVMERGKRPVTVAPVETGLEASRHDLVFVWTCADIENARWAKASLDAAGIPSFWGPDNLESPAGLDLSHGVDLAVREEDFPQARAVATQFAGNKPEPEAVECVCPQCKSPEILFLDVDETKTKFHWSCDACGHEWYDDGVEAEA